MPRLVENDPGVISNVKQQLLKDTYSTFNLLMNALHCLAMMKYLLAVTLSLLPGAHRVQRCDQLGGAVGKVLTAGHRRLVDAQGVRRLEYGVAVDTSLQPDETGVL